jgi:death-on-curing protein
MFNITSENIIYVNKEICKLYNTSFGIINKNLLYSIEKQVNQIVFNKELYLTIQDKITYVVLSIIKNHIFIDGNKRTATIIYFTLCDYYNIKNKSDIYDDILYLSTSSFDINIAKKLLF